MQNDIDMDYALLLWMAVMKNEQIYQASWFDVWSGSPDDTSENFHTSCVAVSSAWVWRSFRTESQLNQADASSSTVSLTPTDIAITQKDRKKRNEQICHGCASKL